MTRSTETRNNGVDDHAGDCAAIARWADEGGAPNSHAGRVSADHAVPVAPWFVPPIMAPAFLMARIIISVMRQNLGHSRLAAR